MADLNIEQQLQDINNKLDTLAGYVAEQQKRQQEMDELKKDMSLIAKDMFDSAVEELSDVAPYFETKDALLLLKKLMRNTRNLNQVMDQFEGARDLFADLQPLGKQMFDQLLDNLNEMDKKGYFEFGSELIKIIDTIVTSFSPQDVKLLRENITTILLTVKSMTQPQMLSSVNNALQFFQHMDIAIERDISLTRLLRQLNDPEVKRGLYFALEFVKNISGQPQQQEQLTTLKKEQ